MDPRDPSAHSNVKGTYFYKRHGKQIGLKGVRDGAKVHLEEKYRGRITGSFDLEYRVVSMEGVRRRNAEQRGQDVVETHMHGTWSKPGAKRTEPVWASRVSRAFEPCFKVNPDELGLATGGTFGDELDRYSGADYRDPEEGEDAGRGRIGFDISHCSGSLFSASFEWRFYAGPRLDPDIGLVRHTFDLVHKREIDLWNEIDSGKTGSFVAYLATLLDPMLADIRSQYPDADWKRLLAPRPEQSIDDFFKATNASKLELYLEGTLMAGSSNYLDLPPQSLREVEMEGEETFAPVDPEELKQYLKADSLLRKLQADR